MRTGAIISGAMHLGLLAFALFGAEFLSGRDETPLLVTEVELIDGTDFEARLSTAPIVPNEGPNELTPKPETDAAPVEIATPDVKIDAPQMPVLSEAPAPDANQPDFQNLLIPPPPVVVPTEAPRPTIAEIPSPDSLPDKAREPESPAATEVIQPLASAPAMLPAPRPMAAPEPEPVASDQPQPKPEEPKQEPEPEVVADAQPDAPLAAAPQEARLPVARPAKVAAADVASGAPAPTPAAPKTAETAKPAEAAGGSTSQFAAAVTRGEKDALVIGLKEFFVYTGNRSDRSLQVTIGVELGPDARIVGSPELLRASGGNPATQNALFQAGRRALIKAQNAGVFAKLPPEKYPNWRLIHVTFTPEEIGFSS